MVSDVLVSLARCPQCHARLSGSPPRFTCAGCGRGYPSPNGEYLDLRPEEAFAEQTRYLDEALHADARHETISPPLLGSGLRQGMLRSFLGPATGDVIIDLGCGSGRTAVWNRASGATFVGTDVSPYFADEARRTIDLALADLRRLPFADASFDKACAVDVLEHLSKPALIQMLSEASRVLKPGGALFIYTHVRKSSPLAAGLRTINRLARGLERLGLVDTTQDRLRKSDHVNPLADMTDLGEVVSAAGFRVARLRFYTPLVGAFIENILVRLAERTMARRVARRRGLTLPDPSRPMPTSEAARVARDVRAAAKRRIATSGVVYGALKALTAVMWLDVLAFGRIEAGPFFALLIREDEPGSPVEPAPERTAHRS